MALDQHASNLIDLTVKTFNGNVTNVSSMDGISLIDSWITFLQSNEQQNKSILTGLNNLKTALQSGSLNGTSIQDTLNNLIDQSNQLIQSVDVDNNPKLTMLTETLQAFSQQLSGSSTPANTGGQAPMTSTVGGESTNSGTGASAFTTEDDDELSNRNGGTSDTATTQSGGRSQY